MICGYPTLIWSFLTYNYRVVEINGHQLNGPVRDMTSILKSRATFVQLVVVSQTPDR